MDAYFKQHKASVAFVVPLVAGTAVTAAINFQLFHVIVAIVSMSTNVGIFTIGWYSRNYMKSSFYLVLGTGLLSSTFFDLIHLIAHPGFEILWDNRIDVSFAALMIAHALHSVSFLFACLTISRERRPNRIIVAYATAVALLAIVILITQAVPFPGPAYVFPSIATISYEILLVGVLGLGFFLFHRKRMVFVPPVRILLQVGIVLGMVSYSIFSTYYDNAGVWSLAGHVLKQSSAYFLLLGIIQVGIHQPHDLLLKELKDAQDARVKDERWTMLGKTAGSMAHEIRNPLAVINNSTYFLRTHLKDVDPRSTRHLDLILQEVQKAAGIIKDVQSLTSKARIAPVRCDLWEVIAEAIDDLHPPKEIQVDFKIGLEKALVLIDPARIKRVLVNIMQNAVQAMPDGGRLAIDVKWNGDAVVVSISDTGTGIPDQDMPHIFEPLFTTKRTGMGLGLCIAKEIVELHRGTISIESTVGKGTKVVIKLPVRPIP